MQSEFKRRLEGAWMGLVWGEQLGLPTEGWATDEIGEFFGTYDETLTEWPSAVRGLSVQRRRRLSPMGLHSSCTQQAFLITNNLLQPQGWNRDRWIDSIVLGFEDGSWRNFGRELIAAAHRHRRGVPASPVSPEFGVDAVVRNLAPGIVLNDDAKSLSDFIFSTTSATHADLRSGASAFAFAWSIGALVSGVELAEVRRRLPEMVYQAETDWLSSDEEWHVDRSGGHSISGLLERLLSDRVESKEVLRSVLSEIYLSRYTDEYAGSVANHGDPALGPLHGLVTALKWPDEPQALVLDIACLGGRTTPVTSIAGAVLGAIHGADWVPVERLSCLERLRLYITANSDLNPVNETIHDLVKHESEITVDVRAFREELQAERRTGIPRSDDS